jgi:hypothetical protein
LSPEAIYASFRELAQYTSSMDIFRMNQEIIYYQLKELLSDENVSLLNEWKNEPINRKIIGEILKISRPLNSSYLEKLVDIIMPLFANDNNSIKKIHQVIKEKQQTEFWDKYKLVVVFIITALICWLIIAASS